MRDEIFSKIDNFDRNISDHGIKLPRDLFRVLTWEVISLPMKITLPLESLTGLGKMVHLATLRMLFFLNLSCFPLVK